jgi:hypothetical protein
MSSRIEVELATPDTASPPSEEVLVFADAAGAANVMQEIVGADGLQVRLVEDQGHWQVVVQTERTEMQTVLARVLAAVERCVEAGKAEFATVRVGAREYTWGPSGGILPPAEAA